jgi:predicted secreted hydrolase
MIYLLRRKDGSIQPESSGTLVEPDGTSIHLKLSDFSVSVLGQWESPRSGGIYPNKWRIRIPRQRIDLEISPLLPDQELNTKELTKITYWEGAVSGQGVSSAREILCEGYVELTGYTESLGGTF